MRKSHFLAIILQFSIFIFPFSVFSQVASGDEVLTPKKIGTDEMIEVSADDVLPGEYSVSVESSSSMFRITEAKLFVVQGEDGKSSMTAKISLSGKGYSKLFMGTAQNASDSNGAGEILRSNLEDGNEASAMFEIPVSALNSPIKCAAFSIKKKKWYDRDILFDASTLNPEGLLVYPEKQQKISLKDGTYLVNVALSGGSGRAGITNPAKITVKDGLATAIVEWSSPNYDYIRMNNNRYDVDKKKLEKGGNSTFQIPVLAFNKKFPVFADTLAMSNPHEILYHLEFDASSVKKESDAFKTDLILLGWALLVILSVILVRFKLMQKGK